MSEGPGDDRGTALPERPPVEGPAPPRCAPQNLVDLAKGLMASSSRRVLGLVGPPGAGKSTLASLLVRALGREAALVPMDGFHLAQAELVRLGRAQRKGAPDTFDAYGYAALLERLHYETGVTVYAPAFRRDLEEPIANALAITPEVRLVVTEGNYLLDLEPPWLRARAAIDEVWYVDADPRIRRQRLMARHVAHGRTPEAAHNWVNDVDELNARRIASTRSRADRTVSPWD
ncbi:MAG TPA: nucleoside/nucleotide kinase family protein [Acidimicrobiales bacterium]|nr:nucleoside/nucleotide kinase family protein [Acidimicrobiales bacterium]